MAPVNDLERRKLIEQLKHDGLLKREIEETDHIGFTPLHEACAQGNQDLLELLLSCGANVHALAGDRRSTALHIAAEYGQDMVLKKLLSTDAVLDLEAKDHEGDTPLHMAATLGKVSVLQLLFENLKRVDFTNGKNQTPLHYAAGSGNLNAVKFLIECGANTNARDKSAATPFHFAARCGNIQVMEELTSFADDKKAFVNDANRAGLTALHYAAWNGRIEAVKWLLQQGASVSKTDYVKGDTPLHWAARKGSADVATTLIQQGADACAANWKGELPIGLAHDSNNGHITTNICTAMRALDRPIMNLLAAHTNNATLLHYGAAYASVKDVQWILEHIRLITARNKDGKDKHFKYNINKADEDDRNPFHWAAVKGNTQVIEVLQKNKVNRLAKDKNGQTPLCLSLIHNKIDFAEKLLKCLGEDLTAEQWMADINNWTDTFNGKIDEALIDAFNEHMIQRYAREKLIHEMPPLYKALYVGKQDIARFIQKHSRGRKDLLNSKGSMTDRTALHWATILGQQDIVFILCRSDEFAIDLAANVTDYNNKTALDYAKDMEILKELLKRGDVQSYLNGLYRDRQIYVDASNAILVGAALIASVTFAGWLQPPLNNVAHDYPQYLGLRLFWTFNSLSFFFAIATVLAGASAMLPVPDRDITKAVTSIRKALLYAASLLVVSIIFVLGAFAAAGFVVLPHSFKYQANMMGTVIVGGLGCLIFIVKFVIQLYKVGPEGLKKLFGPSWHHPRKQVRHAILSSSHKEYDATDNQLEHKVGSRYDDLPWDDGLDSLHASNPPHPMNSQHILLCSCLCSNTMIRYQLVKSLAKTIFLPLICFTKKASIFYIYFHVHKFTSTCQ